MPPGPGAELPQWLIARGVPEEAVRSIGENARECEQVSVGQPPEAGILCTEAVEVRRGDGIRGVYRLLERRKLRVVRSKSPVVVIDVVEAVSPLDKEMPDQPDIVNLELDLAPDGLSIDLRDRRSDLDLGGGMHRSRVSCDAARSATGMSSSSDPIGRLWERFDRELVAQSCSSRGRWVWTAGRFIHVRGGS